VTYAQILFLTFTLNGPYNILAAATLHTTAAASLTAAAAAAAVQKCPRVCMCVRAMCEAREPLFS